MKIKIYLIICLSLMAVKMLEAASVNSSHQARALIQKNLYIAQIQELDFGTISLYDRGGKFTINSGENPSFSQTNNILPGGPDTGLIMVVTNSKQGKFLVKYEQAVNATVSVVATGPLALQGTALGGSEPTTIPFKPTADKKTLAFTNTVNSLFLHIGGEITIENDQAAGIYLGRYIIQISY